MPRPSYFTPGIFGWSLPAGIPAPRAGAAYAGIVHVDGVLLTKPLGAALAAELVPAALVISNMEAEGDGGSGIGVRNATPAAWAAALAASFAPWPGGGAAAAAAVGAAYAAEAAVDADLAYASINSDYGLSCAARALAARVAAAPARAAPLYVLFNAWPRATWSASGNGRWPYHGLDWQAMGEGWSSGVVPGAADFDEAALLQALVGDFARGRGAMPPRWGWAPVSPGAPLATLVVARDGGFPGGGTRAVVGWKEAQCETLAAVGFDEGWWWCD